MMSSMSSMPTESRMVDSLIPAARSAGSSDWECVVEAGWTTSDRTSPTLARSECSFKASMNFHAVSRPPSMSNENTEPGYFSPSFSLTEYHGELFSPGKLTFLTFGLLSRYSATFCAFSLCFAMRRDKVSNPWAVTHALNGEGVAPVSRSNPARAFKPNATFPRSAYFNP